MEKRAERQVAGMFMLASVLIIANAVAYFAFAPGPGGETFLGWGASNLFLGLTLGLALLLIGAGLIQWARKLMGDHEIVEYRHGASSSAEDREEVLAQFYQGAEESGFGRRKLIRNSLLGSLALLGIPAIVYLRDLGPLPGQRTGDHGLAQGHAGPTRRDGCEDPAQRHGGRDPGERRARGVLRARGRRTATSSRVSRASSCRTPRPRPR